MNKLIIFLPLALFALSGCHGNKQQETMATAFVLSDTMLARTEFAPAVYTNAKNELKLYGKISADNNKMVEVFPIVGGSVSKVNAELGDYVQKGQILAEIRSSEVATYEKELLDARSDVMLAEKNLKVSQDLFQSKLNSEKDVMTAQSELSKAKAELARINEVFAIYSIRGGSSYEVRAPLSGFIIQKNINLDMLLRSDRTDNIFDIAQIDEVWVLANVNESDISKISLGIDAEIRTISYPDRPFYGKVDKIFNFIDPETKAMKVRVKINNADLALKPDMNATVTLNFEESQKMIAIPSSAVIFDKSKNFVMVFKDRGNIETRPIKVYRQVGNTTFIARGLQEGEKVITKNQMLIYDALND